MSHVLAIPTWAEVKRSDEEEEGEVSGGRKTSNGKRKRTAHVRETGEALRMNSELSRGSLETLEGVIGSEKARRQTTLVFSRLLKDFCFSGASLGGSLTTWSRLGAAFEPVGGML